MGGPYEAAAYSAEDPIVFKNLLAKTHGNTTRKVTITGAAALIAGTVLGGILDDAVATVTPGTPVSGSGGTVGNGSIGTPTVDDGAMEGTWYVRITAEGSNVGNFIVERPDGTIDGVGTVAVAYNGQLNFTLADGANDWKEDDYIPIVVSYASKKYKKSVAAATDGSQVPDLVLLQDADASAADVEAIALETGTVVATALTLGAGHSVTSIRPGLRDKGILIDD